MNTIGTIMRQLPVLTFVIDTWYQPLAELLPVAYVGASITSAQNVDTATGRQELYKASADLGTLEITINLNHAPLTHL